MQKIISLFKRDYEGTRRVYNEVVPGAEWVLAGEGTPTRKWDGTSCMVRDGLLYKRYDAKHGKQPPPDFIPAQDPDPVTGHWPGWVPVKAEDPGSKWHYAAWKANPPDEDGTYELCGPHFQGNTEGFDADVFIPHGAHTLIDVARTFDDIRAFLALNPCEGIVWHHPDGRMVKIKRKDFGLPWPPKAAQP